jgi:hypothetical protein
MESSEKALGDWRFFVGFSLGEMMLCAMGEMMLCATCERTDFGC